MHMANSSAMHLSAGNSCQACGADPAAAASAVQCSCQLGRRSLESLRRQSLESGSFTGVNFIPFFHRDFQLLMQQWETGLDEQLSEPLPELTAGSCSYSFFCPPGPAPTAAQAAWPAAESSGAGIAVSNTAGEPSWAATPIEGTYLQDGAFSSTANAEDGDGDVNSSGLGACLARRQPHPQGQLQQPAEQPPRRVHVHLLHEQLQRLQLQPQHAPAQQQEEPPQQLPGCSSAWEQLLLQQPQHAPAQQEEEPQQWAPGEARHRRTHLSFSGCSLLSEEFDSLTLPPLVNPYEQQQEQDEQQQEPQQDLGAQLFVPFFRSEPGRLLQA